MIVNKLPEPKEITEEMKTKCTCDIYEWSIQICPYDEDVNNDPNSKCNCCPYHTRQCLDDI